MSFFVEKNNVVEGVLLEKERKRKSISIILKAYIKLVNRDFQMKKLKLSISGGLLEKL